MPYKASGKWVLKKKGGRWVPHKKHASHRAAKKHAQALNINVHHKGDKKK